MKLTFIDAGKKVRYYKKPSARVYSTGRLVFNTRARELIGKKNLYFDVAIQENADRLTVCMVVSSTTQTIGRPAPIRLKNDGKYSYIPFAGIKEYLGDSIEGKELVFDVRKDKHDDRDMFVLSLRD